MKSVKVKSLPIEKVLKDLMDSIGSHLENKCGQYVLTLDEKYGTGKIYGSDLSSGLGNIQYDCTFNQDIEIKFVVNKIHPLKFLYCVEGSITHFFENDKIAHEISQYKSVMVASSSYNGHILHFKKNEHIKINSIEIARKEFAEEMSCEMDSLNPKLYTLISDVDAKETFYHEGFYSLKLAEIFNEMSNFNKNSFLNRVFIESKAQEMLTQHLIQFVDDLSDYPDQSLIRRHEIDSVLKAAQYIRDNLSDLPNVQQIAQNVNLNANKLQEGFRYFFSKSVHTFIEDERMTAARRYLSGTSLNVSEVSTEVGITSKSYFSKLFKEAYGISPSEFKNKVKDKKSF